MADKEYRVGEYQQTSGSWEAAQHVYIKVVDREGRIWLYPSKGPYQGDNVYVGYDRDTKSQGFGGSWLTFKLEDGSEVKLQGPWHTNSGALFDHTGVDLRDKHQTFLVVGTETEYPKTKWGTPAWNPIIRGILYQDEGPKERVFGWYDAFVQELADKANKPVYYYHKTGGGSCSGWKKPREQKG